MINPRRVGLGVIFLIALLVIGGCSTITVEGDTTAYAKFGWIRGVIMVVCGLAGVAGPLLLVANGLEDRRRKLPPETLRGLLIMSPIAIALVCFAYYDFAKSGVRVSTDGVLVRRNWVRSAEHFRFDDLESLELKYSQSSHTGGGGAYFLCATPKPPPGSTWSSSDKLLKRIEIVPSPSVELALPDIFRRATAKGVKCVDDR